MSDHLGPIQFVVIEFLEGQVPSEGFQHVLRQVENGSIFLLDLEFVVRDGDGISTVLASSLEGQIGSLAELDGADSHLLQRDDLEIIAADLEPGHVLAVVIYEDLSMTAAIDAWESAGARLTAEGSIEETELETVLDSENAAHEGIPA